MGLDMFLKKKHYVGAQWEHRKVTGKIEVQINGKPLNINFNNVTNIEEEVAYWRKANHIHNWFVQNVQNGVDNCGEYYVSVEDVKQLLSDCKAVVESLEKSRMKDVEVTVGFSKDGDITEDIPVFTDVDVAEELLPSTSGFFFGSTDYDRYYLDQTKYTIEVLESILNDLDSEGYLPYDIYYSSSW